MNAQVCALRDRIPEFAALSKERLTDRMKRVARLPIALAIER
ncbi:MAG TPA: hypothetical protein VEO54_30725 [Thermoanaerobaculia bacterium]|nr:hypothetical protein [Thermoanaerobaculia bacterium]